MKISSWNVNSVRARINNILYYIKSSKPDILMIQEIKTEEKNFPFTDFKTLGYESYVFGQKSYNGVALLSKIKIDEININFLKDKNKQSRIITGNIKNKSKVIKLINVYIPNGKIAGISKLVRCLDVLSRRPQVQERLTSQWIDAVLDKLSPSTVAVRLQAEHLCMSIRGVEKPGTLMTTTAFRGDLRNDGIGKVELLRLLAG